jgi:hypothetical protein
VIAQCKAAGVAVFVKQLGANAGIQYRGYGHVEGKLTRLGLADSKGGNMDEWPGEDLRVREFPKVAAR